MDRLTVVISSAFAPFSGTGLVDLMGPMRRKVEYGTGIVITPSGHVLTDRLLVEGCNVIQVAGLSDATLLAEDDKNGLALLRVFGVSNLTPAALMHDGARGGDLTLVGIADPLLQAGGRAVTTTTGRLDSRGLQPSPQLGFAGAAALDAQGRLFGVVTLKAPLMAGSAPLPPASVVPVDAIRRFLEAQFVTPAPGRPPRGGERLLRLALAERVGLALGAADAGKAAEFDLGLTNFGGGGGNEEPPFHPNPPPPANPKPRNRRDHRLACIGGRVPGG